MKILLLNDFCKKPNTMHVTFIHCIYHPKFLQMKDDQLFQKARYVEHAVNICVIFVVNCWVGSSYTNMASKKSKFSNSY